MYQNKGFSKIICLLLFVYLICPSTGFAKVKKFFRIATGVKTGVYPPIRKLIAQGLTEPQEETAPSVSEKTGGPDCIAVAHNSAGSVENINTIVSGDTEAGLIQADMASLVY